jgi:CubicO group peptidase (beta-lactamase class C family)
MASTLGLGGASRSSLAPRAILLGGALVTLLALSVGACSSAGGGGGGAGGSHVGGSGGQGGHATGGGGGAGGATSYAELAAVIEAERQAQQGTGVAVAIVEQGALTWAQGFGVKTAGTSQEIRPTTLFRVGELSETLTAIAALHEEEAGHLDLGAPVLSAVPSLALTDTHGYVATIALGELLSHTADLSPAPGPASWPDTSDAALLQYFTSSSVNTTLAPMEPPGTLFSRASQGIDLAGLAVERASAEPYASAVRDAVTGPLGMTRTVWKRAEAQLDGDVTLTPDEIASGSDAPVTRPSIRAWSSVTDLARLAGFLMIGNTSVLSKARYDELVTPHADTRLHGQKTAYAYGLAVDHTLVDRATMTFLDTSDTLLTQHGDIAGYHADLVVVPAKRFAIVVLDNHRGAYPKTERFALERFGLVTDLTPFQPTSAGPATDFVGEYDDGFDAGKLFVAQKGSGLSLTLGASQTCDLVPIETDSFACDAGGLFQVFFARDGQSKVVRIRTPLGIADRVP